MKMPLRVTAGVVVTSVALLGLTVPSGATTTPFKVDAIMKNDLKLKTSPGTQLNMGGSSFDGPLLLAAQSQWNTDNGKTAFSTYQANKSGTGRANVISGAYNIGFSDFPLNIAGPDVGPGSTDPSETTKNYVQVPVDLGGEAILYHLGSGVSAALAAKIAKYGITLNGKTLGQIFAGKVTNWDAPQIKATNPKLTPGLPNLAIAVESRTPGSGTTFVFRDYLSRVDPADFPPPPSAAAFSAAVAQSPNSAALDAAVHSTPGAIGYAEFGYAIANQTPTIKLVNRSHVTVSLSAHSIAAAGAAGLAAIAKHGGFNTTSLAHFSINNAVGKTVWPICGFSYGIVKASQGNLTNAIAIVKFLDFLSHQGGGKSKATTFGQDFADAQGYVALPLGMQKIARSLILHVKSGGHTVLSAKN